MPSERSLTNPTTTLKDKLVFVDVYVDPSEHVYPMLVAPNGSLKDMWLSKDKKV